MKDLGELGKIRRETYNKMAQGKKAFTQEIPFINNDVPEFLEYLRNMKAESEKETIKID